VSTFEFRPAVRERVPLLLGFSGGTGSGKTYSALRVATGIAAGRRFALIDTEAGRAKHYADAFAFDHGDLTPPFTPARYLDAIAAADAVGYPVVVVDSMSHEWAGDGGCLDLQEAELDRMAGTTDFKRRDACRLASWIKPKQQHKALVSKLLQLRAHLILCFRAEPKIEMVKGPDGAWQIRPKQSLVGVDGWIPVAEKNLPYELTASVLLLADRPGVPTPIKLEQQHRDWFPVNTPLTEETGARLAAWAAGGAAPSPAPAPAPAVALPVEDNGAWLARIDGATTKRDLLRVGTELGKAAGRMSAAQIARLRAAYGRRERELAP